MFGGDADFDEVTITGVAGFGSATFTGDAGFGGATFTGDAGFGGATFTGDTWFDGATFGAKVRGLLENDRFSGWTLGPVPDAPHLQQLVPPDPGPVAPSWRPGGQPSQTARAESAFDAAPDGQDDKAEQDGTEEPQGDLEYPFREGEGRGLAGTEH
jgi:hypothetical protein